MTSGKYIALNQQVLDAMIADCHAQYPSKADIAIQRNRFKLWAQLKWGIRLQGGVIVSIIDPARYSWFLLKYGDAMASWHGPIWNQPWVDIPASNCYYTEEGTNMDKIYLVIKEYSNDPYSDQVSTAVVSAFATFEAAQECANQMSQNARKKRLKQIYGFEVESVEFENR